jgi:hypothetical protein
MNDNHRILTRTIEGISTLMKDGHRFTVKVIEGLKTHSFHKIIEGHVRDVMPLSNETAKFDIDLQFAAWRTRKHRKSRK